MTLDRIHVILIVLVLLLVILYYRNYTIEKYSDYNTNKDLIKLWVHHLLYTRLVVMAFLSDDKSINSLMNRLMKNQHDIGDLMGIKYGSKVGHTITNELVKHITIAGSVLAAVKANDKAAQTKSIKEFYDNANNIGVYLDKLMYTNVFAHHMKMHIETLVNDVIAYSTKQYDSDIKLLDTYVNAGLDMAFDMAQPKIYI